MTRNIAQIKHSRLIGRTSISKLASLTIIAILCCLSRNIGQSTTRRLRCLLKINLIFEAQGEIENWIRWETPEFFCMDYSPCWSGHHSFQSSCWRFARQCAGIRETLAWPSIFEGRWLVWNLLGSGKAFDLLSIWSESISFKAALIIWKGVFKLVLGPCIFKV